MSVFEGDQAGAAAFLAENPGTFYVYMLIRPDGQPFYVGEGVGNRVFQHVLEARLAHRAVEGNPFKCNTIRKIEQAGDQIRYRIDSLHPDKPGARRREGALILQIGRAHEGGTLTNLAGGHAHPDSVAPFSREKHTANLSGASEDPERRTLNEFFATICPVGSTPIKPLSAFLGRIRRTTTLTKPGRMHERSAGALVASAACNGLKIAPDVEIPRLFTYDGVPAIVENGVSENITGSGIVRLVPEVDARNERFVLSATACATIRSLLGTARLRTLGVLPD